MADKKVTTMVVKVDLNCEKCRKKIKKVLCDIPHIQNQVYDEKANTVTITVVCCNPEKIKKKICCKGGKTVKGIIESKVPQKPPPAEKPPVKPPPAEKPPVKPPPAEKPPVKPPPAEKPPVKPLPVEPPPVKPPPVKPPPVKPPPPTMLPWPCCRECYEGRGGGPCYAGRGMPAPPCYGGYGRPVYDSWGGGGYRGPCYVSRYDYCVSEENPGGCIIM